MGSIIQKYEKMAFFGDPKILFFRLLEVLCVGCLFMVFFDTDYEYRNKKNKKVKFDPTRD